jgi:hypothetical protein
MGLLHVKTFKDQKHLKYMETLKILNFIHLCLYLPKGYHNPLYRKKQKKNLNNIE